MSNAEDIDAINVYMQSQRSKTGNYPGLQTQLDSWDNWYSNQDWVTKMYDSSLNTAKARRNEVKSIVDTGVPWTPVEELPPVYDPATETITIGDQVIRTTGPSVVSANQPVTKGVGTVAVLASKPSVTEATKIWQSKINAPITGIFEATTQVATENWQSQHGISPDGVVGDDTWFAIGYARFTMPLLQNTVKAVAKEGDSSNTTPAQAFLIWQRIVGVTADGKPGPNTYNATVTWQKNRNCTADGIVGKQTWTAAGYINAAKMPVLDTKGSTTPKPPVPPAVPPKPSTPVLIAGFPVWAQVGIVGVLFGGLYKIWTNKKEVHP
jgi:peptidoglycan hydrolase-like protein with peptidoglycan-binding domain